MSDIFIKADALKLLKKKHILFLGDSNIRALYKDLLWLLNNNTLIKSETLKRKLEPSYMGDKLVKRSELHKGRDFVEVRDYTHKAKKSNIRIEFHFITRCYTKEIEKMMTDIKEKKISAPDVIVMSSLLWDISRWGPNGVSDFKDNMVKLMKLFKASLPPETLVIWTTTLPISRSCHGGFLVKQVEFLKHTLRFEVMEANMFTRQVVVSYGFDVLDFHHHLRMQIHRRTLDGIHWDPLPMRHMTNLLLTHIALSWNQPLPGNFSSPILDSIIGLTKKEKSKVVLPVIPTSLTDATVSPARTDSFSAPRQEPPWRKKLRSASAHRKNQENLTPDYGLLAQQWMGLNHLPSQLNLYGVIPQLQNFGGYNKYGEMIPQGNFPVSGFGQSAQLMDLNYANGPLRQRYINRHDRRHNPYFM